MLYRFVGEPLNGQTISFYMAPEYYWQQLTGYVYLRRHGEGIFQHIETIVLKQEVGSEYL